MPSDDHGFTTAEAVLPSNAGPTVRLRNLLTTEECGRVLELARAHCRYNTTPDSVDGRPTYEAPVYDAATGPVNVGLCRALESAMERRAAPFLRARFGHRRLSLCYALVRRYLPSERREHPAHFDAHAAVTLVVGLNDGSEYAGGYYVQPTAQASSRLFVALERGGDAIAHTYKLRHGVACRAGTRYSLVTWWKPTPGECQRGTADWYVDAALKGDADACYNVAAHRMRYAGAYEVCDPAVVNDARRWYERAAMLGSSDAMARCGVLQESAGDHVAACRWFKMAAKRGSVLAMRRLAAAFLSGRGAVVNKTASRELLTRAAVDGEDAEAMADLASLLHASGEVRAARRWLKRASDRGQPDACCAVAARVLADEDARPTAVDAALDALRHAAASGHARAFVLLARGHLGLCSNAASRVLGLSSARAYACLVRAAADGSREADAFLTRLLLADGPRRDRDRALLDAALRRHRSDLARAETCPAPLPPLLLLTAG